MKTVSCVLAIVVWIGRVGLSQEASVSWDGTSADITGQAANVNSSPGTWDAADAVWSTTDEVVPVVGSQASFKAAIAQAGSAQRRIAQLNAGGDTVFVGGGSTNAEGVAGYAPSPWANLIGFDTTSFDDYFALSSISMTVRNRIAADTLDIRWFVEAKGKTYVSGVVATVTGATTVTLADVRSIEWFAFDKTANIEISAALGSSVGSPVFTDVDYVGIHQQLTYTALGNWHGAWVDNFSATAMFYGPPTNASNEDPGDGRTEVLRDVVLGWTPGAFAATHDVYFGTVFSDVNDASRTDQRNVLVRQDHTVTTYDPPGHLDFGQTYYWRIDEVNAPPTSTIYKGKTWSFTVESIAYPIDANSITATASSVNNTDEGPENTINRLGLDGDDLHTKENADMWLSSITGAQPTWIEYAFDKVYKLHQAWVWNYNSSVESVIGVGIKEATIEYSIDGVNWTAVGTTHEFDRAPGAEGYGANTTIDLGGVAAKYVKITAISNWEGLLMQYGLSEVRFFSIPVLAREPDPVSGATDIDPDATLGWRAGREAAKHKVYLSVDEQAVIDGTASVVTVTSPAYATSLDLASTYYWRVDEVNDAEMPPSWQGDVWSLSTQEYLVVDDFESYNDIPAEEQGSRFIYDTWTDGLENPANGGSTIGYNIPFQPTMETSMVYDGKQSVPLSYDNSTAMYSEVTAKVADLQTGQDWSKYGVKAMTLRFFGDPNNTAQQLYVKLNGAKIAYDSDAKNLSLASWQMWYIDLASLGIDLGNVTDLTIGLERLGGVSGQGMIYLDAIRLYAYERQLVTPIDPGTSGLQGHYLFEGNTNDSSSGKHNGTAQGDPLFTAGKIGQAISMDGLNDYVNLDGYKGIAADRTDPNNPIQGAFSLACWIKTSGNGDMVSWGSSDGAPVGGQYVRFWVDTATLRIEHGNGNLRGNTVVSDGKWHHVAVVVSEGANLRDPATKLFVDGQQDTTFSGSDNIFNVTADVDVAIGMRATNQTSYFPGLIDEVRIYGRALTDGEIAWLSGKNLPCDGSF